MVSSADSILENLNPAQRAAAQTLDGPLCVLAGAGSGKTRVITHRIAYMVRSGIPGDAILGMTFTNKAAREMRDRVYRLAGPAGPRLGTFHSFCAAFLREEFPSVGRSGEFTIYDDADSQALMKRVLESMNVDRDAHRPGVILGQIGRWKNRFILPADLRDDAVGAVDPFHLEAYERYDRALQEANACDFDDLLLRTARILREYSNVLQRWNGRITHILVDEFQDTNPVQYELVRLLSRAHRNLCVTGDPDQSIYSWRGADPGQFDRFLEEHPGAVLVRLEQNYRSTGHILRVASSVIAHNRYRIPKRLWTEDADGEPVRVVAFRDDYEEAAAVASAIREFEQEGFRTESMAVFYRTNALSLPVERALLAQGTPYVVVGGLEFFARQEVKDLLAYLRFLSNPNDVISFKRVINVPPRGIGDKTQERILSLAREQGQSPGELLRNPTAFAAFPSRARSSLEALASGFAALDRIRRDGILPDYIAAVLEHTGYGDYWKGKASAAGSLDPHQNIGQLLGLAEEFREIRPEADVAEFLAHIALLTDLDRTRRREGGVSLMTLHSSKGLEFEVVFLIGVEQGTLPHIMSMDTPEGLEEERRLFHVGLTRARKRLVVTHSGARTRFGRFQPAAPSAFLDELGAEGVELFGDRSPSGFAREAEGLGDVDPWEAEADNPLLHLRKETPVWHPDYGSGVVVQIRGRGTGLDRKVLVRFEDGSERTLILRHARLEIRDDLEW